MRVLKPCKKTLSAFAITRTCHEVNRMSEFAYMRINILSSTTVAKNKLIGGSRRECDVALRHWFIKWNSMLLSCSSRPDGLALTLDHVVFVRTPLPAYPILFVFLKSSEDGEGPEAAGFEVQRSVNDTDVVAGHAERSGRLSPGKLIWENQADLGKQSLKVSNHSLTRTFSMVSWKKNGVLLTRKAAPTSSKTFQDCQSKMLSVNRCSRKKKGCCVVMSSAGLTKAETSWNRTVQTLLKSSLFWLQRYTLLTYYFICSHLEPRSLPCETLTSLSNSYVRTLL